ncbi:alpha/beta fold hydrolase [soil metagenome]
MFGGIKPDWTREGRDWPNREASRFLLASGLRWHVQLMGDGPPLLLLHGACAATHSWRELAPMLARDFTVVAPDLPGHGFTDTPDGDGLSLTGMSRELAGLLEALEMRPDHIVGHSAGAAVALRMALDRGVGGAGIVSLNGALAPFSGAAGHIFPAMAKLLFLNPVAQQMFAWRASQPGAVARLIESTGSTIDASGLAAYAALFRTTGHIAGALGMMARWNLEPLLADMPRLTTPVTLVAAERDLAVTPKVAQAAHARLPNSTVTPLPGLGHLAHEEAPARVAEIIRAAVLKGADA